MNKIFKYLCCKDDVKEPEPLQTHIVCCCKNPNCVFGWTDEQLKKYQRRYTMNDSLDSQYCGVINMVVPKETKKK